MNLIIAIVSIVAFAYLTRKKYPKIKGWYSQDYGLWFGVKYAIAVVLLTIRSAVQRFDRRTNTKHSEQGDWESPDDFVKNDKMAMNTWALIGGDKKGNVLLVRMCRRLEGRIEIWLILRLADGRTFTHPAHPETLVQDETPFGDEFEDAYMAGAAMRFRAYEPAKTFRFSYAGMMRLHKNDFETLATDGFDPVTNRAAPEPDYVEVDIRVWFRGLADPAEYGIDGHPEAIARAIANEDWGELRARAGQTVQHSRTPHAQQSGEMRGFVKILGGDSIQIGSSDNQHIEHVPLNLWGMRNRTRGRRDWACYHSYLAHFGMLENGTNFSLTVLSNTDGIATQLLSGFWMEPNGYVYAVSWSDMALPNFPDAPSNLPVTYEVHFTANCKMHTLKVTRLSAVTLPHGEDWPAIIFLSPARFEIDGVVGHGNVEYEHNNDGRLKPNMPRPGIAAFGSQNELNSGLVRRLPLPEQPRSGSIEYPLCTSLKEPHCCLLNVAGGKAAKLAQLLQAKKSDEEFSVPDGFALTVGAFDRHVAANPTLREAIDRLIASTGTGQRRNEWHLVSPQSHEIEAACEKVVNLFKTTPLIPEIKSVLRKYMESTFGNDWQHVFVAVRSSGVGDDSDEASSAGTVHSHLHIQGEAAIEESIKKCWATNFDYRAIAYRRQICTKIDQSMGVLIQRLVAVDLSGDMFTRDPSNGSMARMIINTNFGEEASRETITVKRHDFIDWNRLDIVQSQKASKRCLDDDTLQRLARVGLAVERAFGSARNIEWAIVSDGLSKPKLHILQARPIPTIDREDDWELEHEFDTPLASENEWLTTANVREMMPGALTPLSAGIWVKLLSSASDNDLVNIGQLPWRRIPVARSFGMFYQHPFFNYTMTTGQSSSPDGKYIIEMSIFGQIKPELPSVESLQRYCSNTNPMWHFMHKILNYYHVFFPERTAERISRKLSEIHSPHATDPEMLLQQIVETIPLMQEGWLGLVRICGLPIACQIIMMKMMNKDAEKWSSAEVANLAVLLQSCPDVYTVDVPKQMRAIAVAITKAGRRVRFLSMDNTEAAKWLLLPPKEDSSAAEPNRLFKAFLKKHGHRCVRETEFRETSWRQQPEKVVEAIKAIMTADDFEANMNKINEKRELSVDESLDALSKPFTGFKRKFLRWLLPKARNAVGRREWGKSLAIETMNLCREAVHRLGHVLTERGVLPDQDLVFFLTLYELSQLIKGPSAKLISKALRRRLIHERLMTLEFEELSQGYPEPLCQRTQQPALVEKGTKIVLKGIPVGWGSVEGTARVLSSFDDAHKIKQGDILVVPYTDVGWTPYFPLIDGLVTELGGLLSHGAVVAREYGLPCLVGCKQATRIVPDGARVRIDGATSTLTVLD